MDDLDHCMMYGHEYGCLLDGSGKYLCIRCGQPDMEYQIDEEEVVHEMDSAKKDERGT